jgi:hypothetical protein
VRPFLTVTRVAAEKSASSVLSIAMSVLHHGVRDSDEEERIERKEEGEHEEQAVGGRELLTGK